jgi:hypothetical protein
MIENDRIPLDVYRRTLGREAELLTFDPNPQCNIGDFENWLLAMDRTDPSLEEKISARLHEEIAAVARCFDERDALSGLSLPSSDDIWLLSYRIGEQLRLMDGISDSRPLLAELFGAGLQVTARKQGLGEIAPDIFRRDLSEDRGVFVDPPRIGGVTLNFSNTIPEIEAKSEALTRVFPETSWFVVEEGNGSMSITNHADGGPILLPATKEGGLLLLRIHSVPADAPYVFTIRVDESEVYSFIVTQAEGHLARVYVEPHAIRSSTAFDTRRATYSAVHEYPNRRRRIPCSVLAVARSGRKAIFLFVRHPDHIVIALNPAALNALVSSSMEQSNMT